KCIYEKLTDEEVDCCPICNIDLGCTPIEKLRPDHNLQDVRAKIFPFKRRKVKAPEVIPSISLPIRRKERSLSSLVVSAPRVATQNGLTGRRTKVVTRKSSALRGLVIDEPIKKEEDTAEDHQESSSSPERLSKTAQNKRQNFPNAESSSHASKKDADNSVEPSADKTELWKPLNCLVEAANRTKSLKFSGQGSISKFEISNGSQSDISSHKTKTREHPYKSKLPDDKNSDSSATPALPKVRRMHGVGRKRAATSRDFGVSAQALLDAASGKRERRISPIWFSLIADSDQ
ncbi:hypothetical protein Taro_034251, partial [Colocasia esculenta]|nr:hypothetical protein [Colocasia esculenta]